MRYVPDYINKIYNKSPVILRNIYSTGYSILKNLNENNRVIKKYLISLIETQYYSKSKLEEIQAFGLKKIITYAFENVPYYKNLFEEHGFTVKQFQSAEDLKTLPVLNKSIIKTEFNNLISNRYKIKNLRTESTSGTTGSPFKIYLDNETFLYTRAVIKLQHLWAGYNKDDWVGILSGYKVIPIVNKKPPFWIKNYYKKQIHLSTYHINKENVYYYYNTLRNNSIKFLLGYPSSIGLLAKFISDSNYDAIELKGVFLGSEPIYDWQRKSIKDAFNCPIYDLYAQAENVIVALSCGMSKSLHTNMEGSILETQKLNENQYKIIGTSLINFAMPMIRYDIGDITGGYLNEVCKCGRKHKMIKPIETKVEDFILTPDGNYISASILTFPFKTPKGIIESQIIQNDKDALIINLITDKSYTKTEETKLINEVKLCVGSNMKIYIDLKDHIQRTNNGKYRFVINNYRHITFN